MNGGEKKEHCTISEAAEILSVSERTIFNWIKQGKIESHKIDGRTFIEAEKVFQMKEKEVHTYDPEKHVLIDRTAFDSIMKELQSSREMFQQHGYRIGQLEAEKRHLEEHVRLIEDKRPWWKRWRRK